MNGNESIIEFGGVAITIVHVNRTSDICVAHE